MTPTDVDRLRTDLKSAQFNVEALTRLWGAQADAALHRGQRTPALRALAGPAGNTPAATLAHLFVLGMPVSYQRFARDMPLLGVEGALNLGLIAREGDTVRSILDLRPYNFVDSCGEADWWIASDLGELSKAGSLREDHVLGVGGASLSLSALMLDSRVEAALDLGTGCGIQAMHAARHAGRVVATDISPRALKIAAFNAELNGIKNIEFRLGNLFEPVAGERFGQILSNPPFVITPRVAGIPAYEYRDGNMIGDDLMAAVVASLVAHLEPGGVAQLLGNWEYRQGRGGLDRVAEWTDATGLDAWVVERERQDTGLYAETWIRDGGTKPGAEFDRLYAAWLDDFERRGVSAVGFGYLTLRATKRGLRRLERLDGPLGAGLGAHVGETLAAADWLADRSDDDLGREFLVAATDVTEDRHYWPGSADPTVMTLRQGGAAVLAEPCRSAPGLPRWLARAMGSSACGRSSPQSQNCLRWMSCCCRLSLCPASGSW